MSSIFGVYNLDRKPINEEAFNQSMDLLGVWGPDKTKIWSDGFISFGNHFLETTVESQKEEVPFFDRRSGCCINADARIDYRSSLIAHIGIRPKSDQIPSDTELILYAYLKWGKDCVKYLIGDFVFVIWDSRKEILFCARDHFGCRPFYYFSDKCNFIFSSEMSAFKAYVDIHNISEEYIVDCVLTVLPEKSRTFRKDIHRLLPAHSMIVKPNGQLRINKYWDLKVIPKYKKLDSGEAIAALKSAFMESVKQRTRSAYMLGAELSGGLDSSGIVSIISKFDLNNNKPLHTFTHALSNRHSKYYPFKDETEFSNEITNSFKGILPSIITGEGQPGALNAIEDFLRKFEIPINQAFSVMNDNLFESASNKGVRVLLSGFGGDEGVTSQANKYYEELSKKLKWRLFRKQVNYEKGRRIGNTG